MIGNFEPKQVNLNLSENIINFSDYSSIVDLFLCTPNSSFTISQFITEVNWQYFIADNYHVKDILDVSPQTEETIFQQSRFNFRYILRPGKYRFVCLVNVDIEYFAYLKKLEGCNFGCYFKDINDNLFGRLSGGNVLPFTLEFVGVQKIQFGNSSDASMTGIVLDFHDANELINAYIVKSEIDFANLSPIYRNIQYSQDFTRNNCSEGESGTVVTYTVPAHTYTSTISQAAANALAQADIAANGQAYANSHGSCNIVYWNVEKSQDFTRNNCGEDYEGTLVTYTVAAHTYSSTVSQLAADNLALADIAANGQAYANSTGTCTLIADYLLDADLEIFTDFDGNLFKDNT